MVGAATAYRTPSTPPLLSSIRTPVLREGRGFAMAFHKHYKHCGQKYTLCGPGLRCCTI